MSLAAIPGTVGRISVARLIAACAIAVLAVAIVASNVQTALFFDEYLTDYDDIGVAEYLYEKTPEERRASQSRCEQRLDAFARKLAWGALSAPPACAALLDVHRYVTIPLNWTYAPFQFLFTQAPLRHTIGMPFEKVVFLGRLPSLVFSLLGIAGLFILARRKLPVIRRTLLLPLVLAAIPSLSLEQKIFSSHMSPYAIGLLSNLAILSGLYLACRPEKSDAKRMLAAALLMTLGAAMGYQGVFLIFAGLLAIAVFSWRTLLADAPARRNYLALVAFTALAGIFSYLPFFVHVLIDRGGTSGVHWNAGPNGEFIVSPGLAFPARLWRTLQLLWEETPYNFYAALSGIELSGHLLAHVLGAVFVGLFLAGIYFLLRRRHVAFFGFSLVLLACYLLVVVALVFLGRLAYSPTRHYLYFLVPLSVVMTYGVLQVSRSRTLRYLAIVAVVSYSLLSVAGFAEFIGPRLQKVDEGFVTSVVNANGVNLIVADSFDLDTLLMSDHRPKSLVLGNTQYKCAAVAEAGHGREYRALWYSRRREFASARDEIDAYLKKMFRACAPSAHANAAPIVSPAADRNFLTEVTDVQVELSNRTRTAGNSYFVQQFLIRSGGKEGTGR